MLGVQLVKSYQPFALSFVQDSAGPVGERIISARQLIQIIPVAWDEGDVKDYKVRVNPLLERQQVANSLRHV